MGNLFIWRGWYSLAYLAQGGHGFSVTANVAPKLCSDMHKAWREKYKKLRKLIYNYQNYITVYF